MHPAPSVILFTSLSGVGFGLLFFLGLGMPASTGLNAFIFYAIAYVFAVGGLLFSTFHLGHPERALKAFTQWRSSWLSREAWLAVLALCVTGIGACAQIFFETRITVVSYAGAALCLLTVFSTAMIYRQLATVPRWHTPMTPVLFLTYAIAGGALLSGQIDIAQPVLGLLGALQIFAWIQGDGAFARSGSTLNTATGLGDTGSVRAFEPPHTGTNYLLQEFVYVVGRKHAAKLRLIAIILLSGLPIVLLVLPFNHMFAALAVLTHVAGVLVSRWLFFAQAEHVVGLYYGKRG
jgi:DMSO reductase anchor subunit